MVKAQNHIINPAQEDQTGFDIIQDQTSRRGKGRDKDKNGHTNKDDGECIWG